MHKVTLKFIRFCVAKAGTQAVLSFPFVLFFFTLQLCVTQILDHVITPVDLFLDRSVTRTACRLFIHLIPCDDVADFRDLCGVL